MAEQDHWLDRPAGSDARGGEAGGEAGGANAITRLETALARIATAAGRRQDALRVAELTARAAQHEADLLSQADERNRSAATASAAAAEAEAEQLEQGRVARLRDTAEQLDVLIARLRTELQDPAAGE